MRHRSFPVFLAACVVAHVLGGCARTKPPPAPAQGPNRTVLSNVRATGTLSALTGALEASGLAETLAGPGPFTLFAPTDEAFAALPDSLRSRFLPGSPERYNVLAYHVVPALVTRAEFDGRSVRTLNGAVLSVERTDSVATVNRRPLLAGELPASNGIVYFIDAILIPPGARE